MIEFGRIQGPERRKPRRWHSEAFCRRGTRLGEPNTPVESLAGTPRQDKKARTYEATETDASHPG